MEPTARMVRRTETVEVTALLEVAGLDPVGGVDLHRVDVVAWLSGDRSGVRLRLVGTNTNGVTRDGRFSAPHAAGADPTDPHNTWHGHVNDLPRELLELTEKATGIRFADYSQEDA